MKPGTLFLVGGLMLGAPLPASAGSPAVDYMLECQGCHLPDGAGAPDVPDLRNTVGRFLAVPGGRAYLVQVPGSSQSALGDAELAAVLNWMVTNFDPGTASAGFQPFDGEEISTLRVAPLVDVEGVRRGLVSQFATD